MALPKKHRKKTKRGKKKKGKGKKPPVIWGKFLFIGAEPKEVDIAHVQIQIAAKRLRPMNSRKEVSNIIRHFNSRKLALYSGNKSEITILEEELKLNGWFAEQAGISLLAPQSIAWRAKRIKELEKKK